MEKVNTQRDTPLKAGVIFPAIADRAFSHTPETRLEEAVRLAQAIYLDVAYQEIVKLRELKPASFFGQGYIEKLLEIIAEQGLELIIVDTSLSPIQQRNLEKKLKIKVIDRTALILEIFGERAQTKEGNLQVELAHLTYQRSRLVRSWTHLERQRGGAGFLGGPGETQIELDRRIIDDKIVRIKKDLEKVKKTRELQRGARSKIPYPVVALVGYTNAGKSSLFNRLTHSDVFAQDLLFATLDPTMRKLRLPSGRDVILSDTVGFISDLPHELIMSFRATLEEVLAADIVVHVRDLANPNHAEQKQDVLTVLKNLGLEDIENQANYLEVWNKVDILSEQEKAYVEESAKRYDNIIPTSTFTGLGCDDFLRAVDNKLARDYKLVEVRIPVTNGKLIAWIYDHAEVLTSNCSKETQVLKLRIADLTLAKLATQTKIKRLPL